MQERRVTSSTPSNLLDNMKRQDVLSPDLRTKVKRVLAKDRRRPESPTSGSSASSCRAAVGVSDAFSLISNKFDTVDAKMSALATHDLGLTPHATR